MVSYDKFLKHDLVSKFQHYLHSHFFTVMEEARHWVAVRREENTGRWRMRGDGAAEQKEEMMLWGCM